MNKVLQTVIENPYFGLGLNFTKFLCLFLLLVLTYFVFQICFIGAIKLLVQIMLKVPFLNYILRDIFSTVEKNEQLFPLSLLKSRLFFIMLSVPMISFCYFLFPQKLLPFFARRVLLISTFLTWMFSFFTFSSLLSFEKSSKVAFHSSILSSMVISIFVYYNLNIIIY
jgi:hypothetical protein